MIVTIFVGSCLNAYLQHPLPQQPSMILTPFFCFHIRLSRYIKIKKNLLTAANQTTFAFFKFVQIIL